MFDWFLNTLLYFLLLENKNLNRSRLVQSSIPENGTVLKVPVFWVFLVRLWTELQSRFPYWVRMRQNTDQENSEYRQFLHSVAHLKKEGIGFEGFSTCQGKNNKCLFCVKKNKKTKTKQFSKPMFRLYISNEKQWVDFPKRGLGRERTVKQKNPKSFELIYWEREKISLRWHMQFCDEECYNTSSSD